MWIPKCVKLIWGLVLFRRNTVFRIFACLKACKYANMSSVTDVFLGFVYKFSEWLFPEQHMVTKGYICLSRTSPPPPHLRLAGLFKHVYPLVTTSIKGLNNTTGFASYILKKEYYYFRILLFVLFLLLLMFLLLPFSFCTKKFVFGSHIYNIKI